MTVEWNWDAERGFAYVRNHILVPSRLADEAAELIRRAHRGDRVVVERPPAGSHHTLLIVDGEVLEHVAALGEAGIDAQPDHVFFLHGCCCPPTPCARPAGTGPGPRPHPVRSLPRSIDRPVPATGPVPAPAPAMVPPPGDVPVQVVILDTGIASGLLVHATTPPGTANDTGDGDGDGLRDEFGGHGTFIAGLVENRVPGVPIEVVNVVKTSAVGGAVVVEYAVANEIRAALTRHAGKRLVFGLSFGGGIWDSAGALNAAIRAAQNAGAVVVASAGNDATCLPEYPAAFAGVVSVGAIGPAGPAEFTNFGPWVRCCAPGVDLTSRFFMRNFDEPAPMAGAADPDEFTGYARWSGTSFAVPLVIAALVRDMVTHGRVPTESVAAVVDAPWLGRMPALGTVVNL